MQNDTDTYCLFYAVELVRLHIMAKTKNEKDNAYRLATSWGDLHPRYDRQRRRLVRQFLRNANGLGRIPANKEAYGVNKYLPHVEAFYNRKYTDGHGRPLFRIAVFDKYCNPHPLYKSVHRAKHTIAIMKSENHFDGIRNINSFLGVKKYCIDCEVSYNDNARHKAKCKAKCALCGGVGVDYPCPRSDGYVKQCDDCHRRFYNEECFDRHLTTMCAKFHACEDCGVTHQAKKEHKCGAKYCSICYGYHSADTGCFVQQEEPSKWRKYYRLVVYDFESTQDTQLNNSDNLHVVNCVCAYLLCNRCIQKNKWQSEDAEECRICGVSLTLYSRFYSHTCLD